MYPEIFGFLDSYTVMMVVGIAAAIVLFAFLLKKKMIGRNPLIDLMVCACVAVIFGLVFSILFENLYEFIDDPKNYTWTFGMTWLGGLIGGVIGFLLMYFLYFRKHHEGIIATILVVAPSCILIGQGFGRIGCFLAGCCYGIESDSAFAIMFPGHTCKVLPTQLFEAIFLFIFGIIVLIITLKTKFKYTFSLYLLGYGLFRFLLEFIRGDYRGAYLGVFSPSQVICLIMIVGSLVYYFLAKAFIFRKE